MSDQSSGSSLIVASIVIGLALITTGMILKGSIDEGSAQLAATVGQMQELTAKLAAAPAQPAAKPSRPGRPDPSKKYDVKVGSAPSRGKASAPVKIVEWSDFQCPFCRRVGPTLDQIEKEYGDKVQIAFKHMPLSMHAKARPAHAAAEAAAMQGKFWEMHDKIFADQRGMSEEKYLQYAAELGLDTEKFKKDAASDKVEKRIAADSVEGSKLGVTGTPAFFVNGRFLSGAQPFASFKKLVDEELAAN
ncbi:MAG: thioredoxin domain-containing protein [Myxococcota bacterium]|nr:thioredoxin domain-containing protein [Myxococcota bacterium]